MKTWFKPFLIMILILLAGCSVKETTSTPKEQLGQPSQQNNSTLPSDDATPPFTFAVTGDFKPFNFEQDGQLRGFDVELGKEIARRLGRDPQPQKVAYDELVSRLKDGEYEAVISSLSITPGRIQEVAFSTPYYVTGAQMFVTDQNEAVSLAELKDKKIGVIKGTPYVMLAQNHSQNIKEYPNYVQMLQELMAGKTDAVLMDKMVGLTARKEEKLNIKPIGELLFRDEVAIALASSNQELLQQINRTLDELIEDGTYARISSKWFDIDIEN